LARFFGLRDDYFAVMWAKHTTLFTSTRRRLKRREHTVVDTPDGTTITLITTEVEQLRDTLDGTKKSIRDIFPMDEIKLFDYCR